MKIELSRVIVGDFNTPLSLIDKSFRQKNQPRNLEMNETIDLMDLTDVYHATTQYTILSATYGTFSKIDHILGSKARLNKYKKIEISSAYDLTTSNKTTIQWGAEK
jgi:hypothetical protein